MIDTIADFICKNDEIKELKRQLANMKSHREREIKTAVDECRIVAKMLSACAEFANRLGSKSNLASSAS